MSVDHTRYTMGISSSESLIALRLWLPCGLVPVATESYFSRFSDLYIFIPPPGPVLLTSLYFPLLSSIIIMKATTLDNLPVAYISHDSTVEKKVLLKMGEVPNVAQLAVATLKPGEQASKHLHKDMTESTLHSLALSMHGCLACKTYLHIVCRLLPPAKLLFVFRPLFQIAFHFQSGTGEMEVNDKIFEVKAGTTVTVFPMESHEIR